MNDDELRRRMQAADPARTSTPESSWIPDLVEATMSTPAAQTPSPRRWLVPVAAAAAVAAIASGAVLALDGDDEPSAAKPVTISLEVPASDAMSMCMAFEPALLARAEIAFSGVVEDVDDQRVILEVDHWYHGGTAQQVALGSSGAAANAALDGVSFEKGARYLVSASDGTVTTCGYSGPWTADFAAQFAAAFGS